jgi:hypothetical protein
VLHGKRETHLCRGARDFQLFIFSSPRIYRAPTDSAWDKAQAEVKASRCKENHMKSTEQPFRTIVALMSDEEILRMRKRITLKMKDDADGSSLYEALSDELLGRDAIAKLNAERQIIELCEWNRGRKLTPPGADPSLGAGADDREL